MSADWARQLLCVREGGGGKSENGASITGAESPRHVCDPHAWNGRPGWVTPSREGHSHSKGSACNAETRVRALCWEDSLEKGAATHSSILDWRIPRTEEPGRLQSIESTKSQTWLSNFDFTQYVQELERNSPGVWKFMAWENKEPAETGRAWACLAHGHLSVNCLLKWPEQYVVSV